MKDDAEESRAGPQSLQPKRQRIRLATAGRPTKRLLLHHILLSQESFLSQSHQEYKQWLILESIINTDIGGAFCLETLNKHLHSPQRERETFLMMMITLAYSSSFL